ncbi:hypothetical protein AOQ84DRAFT_375138 [Glonium stellatum]|uniref:Uncharacterized protein n=1 Tax=Glonium stellatum TaxID=574774 RepID=A0A8E2F577_9PEZI|nr:hypothetical protein AOQ84DRAFT_375138 [Glonium stellatum]
MAWDVFKDVAKLKCYGLEKIKPRQAPAINEMANPNALAWLGGLTPQFGGLQASIWKKGPLRFRNRPSVACAQGSHPSASTSVQHPRASTSTSIHQNPPARAVHAVQLPNCRLNSTLLRDNIVRPWGLENTNEALTLPSGDRLQHENDGVSGSDGWHERDGWDALLY